MHKVLITGITGFLGSHIAEQLLSNQIEIVGLTRKNSDKWRCEKFAKSIEWIEIDEDGLYKSQLIALQFDTIIHSAWIGVESDDRNNWTKQGENIQFLIDLLEVAISAGVNKFIVLGSQAEYGQINGKINEEHNAVASNAYGSVKLACLEILKTFSSIHNMTWIWLRLFSVFGERENNNWLIPSLIKTMKESSQMALTSGEQKYAYLYVKDFATMMSKIVTIPVQSGVYNISSNSVRTIRSLIEEIRAFVKPSFQLNFGALPYRDNQSMHMEGDIQKITTQIGNVEFTDFNVALQATLNYYIKI